MTTYVRSYICNSICTYEWIFYYKKNTNLFSITIFINESFFYYKKNPNIFLLQKKWTQLISDTFLIKKTNFLLLQKNEQIFFLLQLPESAIMFTRLDSERNAKIMKKAVYEEKLNANRYKVMHSLVFIM